MYYPDIITYTAYIFMHISTGVVLPCQAERQRMPTTASRCAHTPLLSMLAHTYLFMEFYIFILACITCTLPARGERAPCSTNTLQGCFHRCPGLSFIVSCTLRAVSSCG